MSTLDPEVRRHFLRPNSKLRHVLDVEFEGRRLGE
jgi:hypothetical protein